MTDQMTTHAAYHALRPDGPGHDLAIRGAVCRERLVDEHHDLPARATTPIITAFLAADLSRTEEPAALTAAIQTLTDTLAAARNLHIRGESLPKAASFREYARAALGNPTPSPSMPAAQRAARLEAARIAASGGLARKRENGTVQTPRNARNADAIAATVRSVSIAEIIAIRERLSAVAEQAVPGYPAERLAKTAAEGAGLTDWWAEEKNASILSEPTLRLMDLLPPERRSLAVHNSLVPATRAAQAVMERTPAVAIIWLDSIAYARRDSDDLRKHLAARSPGDIVRATQAMCGLDRPAWRRLATTEPGYMTTLLDDCRPPNRAPVALDTLMAEQYRWRKPVYDLIDLRAAAGTDPHQDAEIPTWNSMFSLLPNGDYPIHPSAYQNLALAFYRQTDGRAPSATLVQQFISAMDLAREYARDHDEGQLPKRTWDQYMAMSARWHARNNPIEIRNMSTEEKKKLVWFSALRPYEDGDYRVTPLTSQVELEREGRVMNHCVGMGGYAAKCVVGTNRLFRIDSLSADPSLAPAPVATVQIVDNARNGRWRVGQVQGSLNKKVPAPARRTAQNIPALYAAAQKRNTR